MRGFLDWVDAGKQHTRELPDTAMIGRHRDCEIVLSSEAVSRRHARIDRVDRGFLVHDLGSRNGTAVNGVRITAATLLHHGDRLTICDHDLYFRSPSRAPTDLRVTMVDRDLAEGTIVSTMDLGKTSSRPVDPATALAAVLAVTRELGSNLELDDLLGRVLDRIFDVYPHADRGVILLLGEDGEPVPTAVKSRRGAADVQVSRTVLARALARREAILSANAAVDAQFEPSRSLLSMPIHSLMCVPLLGRDGRPMGVIQLHSEVENRQFTESNLDLLVSVAGAATVAIENARLHEQALRQDRLERDVQHAREVQRSFLPAGLPDLPGYRFHFYYEPALSVGGDYYGFLRLAAGELALGIGDVSGKGLPAALMMARLSSEVRFAVQQTREPAQALRAVNRSLLESGLEDRFVTFVLMTLDPARHDLAVANAGHLAPLLRRADGSLHDLCAARTLPLNVMGDERFAPEAVHVELAPGDTVLVYTDGVSDVADREGEMFGDERVRELLARSDGDPARIVEALTEAMRAFANGTPPRDDATIVCFGRA